MGRRPIGKRAMTPAERQRRRYAKAKRAARYGAKKLRRDAREQALAHATAAASEQIGHQLYGVIYADPPWRFEPWSRETGMDRAADNHYPTAVTTEIASLKVPAADDCILFLWATAPMLDDALAVMRAWGFAYKSHYIWVKHRVGTGYWNRNKHELLLFGTRGNVPAPVPGTQSESVILDQVGDHSEKPAAFAEMIERMFPHVPKLEMFARCKRNGWDAWGNEALPRIRQSLPKQSPLNNRN